MTRAEEGLRLPPSVDLLVIGGGITGAGIALEAARVGLSVAPRRAGRLRLGDVEPLLQARPRRAAVPRGREREADLGGGARAGPAPRGSARARRPDRLPLRRPQGGPSGPRCSSARASLVYDLLAREGRHERLTRGEFLLGPPTSALPGSRGASPMRTPSPTTRASSSASSSRPKPQARRVRNYVRCEGLLRDGGRSPERSCATSSRGWDARCAPRPS